MGYVSSGRKGEIECSEADQVSSIVWTHGICRHRHSDVTRLDNHSRLSSVLDKVASQL